MHQQLFFSAIDFSMDQIKLNTRLKSSQIDVIVPVYRGLSETRRCLESVMTERQRVSFDLIVIDDCSPDPELHTWLASLQGRPDVTLLVNETNLGFVASVNRGMSLHPERDVVLLNSDTEVANDWLDRLRRCAYSESRIGTVTPFSNNATICSYPEFCVYNPLPADVGLKQLDDVFGHVNARKCVDIPTAVGFCMYIRRLCLDEVGLFDVESFGKGYGEENDFSRRAVAAGWRNVLCADTFVYHAGGVSFSASRQHLQERARDTLSHLHTDYEDVVKHFVAEDPAKKFRLAVDAKLAKSKLMRLKQTARPVQLHITHDLGGGSIKWLKDYCQSDHDRVNFVLKPWSCSYAYGEGLALYASVFDQSPIKLWFFSSSIQATTVSHPEYKRALEEVIHDFNVGAILISSLIGHSLDALKTGKTTLIVCHDYYPYCPAINLYYDQVCQSCDAGRLRSCCENNKDFNHFLAFTCQARQSVREAYLGLIGAKNIVMTCPSHSVSENLKRLDKHFQDVSFVTIPHGTADVLPFLGLRGSGSQDRLRILVLGQMSIAKGMKLVLSAIDELTEFADVFLVGCAEAGELFRFRPGVHVLSRYELAELPTHIGNIRPDVGLLASICAETYSYTLSELFMMGVPPVATIEGSFPERIKLGETGYLFESSPDALIKTMRDIAANRLALADIRTNLGKMRFRSAMEMVNDYHQLLPISLFSPAGTSDKDAMTQTKHPISVKATDQQVLLLADMWKELKSLRISVAMSADTNYRLDHHCQNLQGVFAEINNRVSELEAQLRAKDAEIADKNRNLQAKDNQLESMRYSTSWRVTKSIRWAGDYAHKVKLLWRCLGPLRANPHLLPSVFQELFAAWRSGGVFELKRALLHLSSIDALQRAWQGYQRTLDANCATIRRRIETMPRKPKISILVPTYNTPEKMLHEMLGSVLEQLYPNWELCIADDASVQNHVQMILNEYAVKDERIKLVFGDTNRGVSHATNCALALATGDFVVLLDHDDLLEKHALYRVAESILTDNPDILYSDEILISGESQHVEQIALRPVFSPEYLRSHPYIVHMVGFKTVLLREIGGWDENLSISQDYDLILRASEKSRTIVHIPEILYRWRINHQSAGQDKRKSVMDVSTAVLRRHIERSGENATITEGPGFNFFDIRYSLQSDNKVAIVIPTKNHGQLLRQCIDSIRRTVTRVAYDIVVIDHDSDDLETLTYLNGIGPEILVLRYSGPFNFSKINNWAIIQLKVGYTHYLLCNNDIEAIREGWLERMMELGQKPDVGVVGAMLYYPDGVTIQHAGVCVGAYGAAEHYAKRLRLVDAHQKLTATGRLAINHEMSAVTAACLLIRKEAFDEVNGLDAEIAVGFGDVDLCLKVLEQGYRILFCPYAELLHHESFTRGTSTGDPHPEDSDRFKNKWADFLRAGDPYFNPGYTIHSTTWDIDLSRRFEIDIRRRVYTKGENGSRQRVYCSSAATSVSGAV